MSVHLKNLTVAAAVASAALAVPGTAQARPTSPSPTGTTTQLGAASQLSPAERHEASHALTGGGADRTTTTRQGLSADTSGTTSGAAAAAELPFASGLYISFPGGAAGVTITPDGTVTGSPIPSSTRTDYVQGPAGDSFVFGEVPSNGATNRSAGGLTIPYPESDVAVKWAPAGDGFVEIYDGKVWAQSTNPGVAPVDLEAPTGVTGVAVSPYGGEVFARQDTGSGSTLLVGPSPFYGFGGPAGFEDLGLSDHAPGAPTLGMEPGRGLFPLDTGLTYLAFEGSVPGSGEPRLFVDHQDGTPDAHTYTNPVAVADTGFNCGDAAAPEFSPNREMLAYVVATGPAGDECSSYEVHVKTTGADTRYDAGDPDAVVYTGASGGGIATNLSWKPNNPKASLDRVGGLNRFEVSANTAYFWPQESADSVVVSGGWAEADALSGGPLAVAGNGPSILTHPTTLRPETLDAIFWALKPGGTVYVVGGTPSVSAGVVYTMRQYGLNVTRIGGNDRFAVAVNVAKKLDQLRGAKATSAFVSSGWAFADALVAGPPAVQNDAPILLSNGSKLPDVTSAYLDSLGVDASIYAVGGSGSASVSGDPRTEVVGGATRYDVAGNVAQRFFAGWWVLALADGRNWPDAVSGGTLMATWGQPILLTNGTSTLPAGTLSQALQTRDSIDSVIGFGGTPSIPDGALTAAQNAAGYQTTYFGPDTP